jgi:uncharacterized membrane protein HdeD (DUF308 family)
LTYFCPPLTFKEKPSTMSNTHQEKYITKLLFGFAFTTAGILLILYAAFERTREEDWYFWGIVASILINAGLYFLLSAFVHKVKSDLIKRQKSREQQKTFIDDE